MRIIKDMHIIRKTKGRKNGTEFRINDVQEREVTKLLNYRKPKEIRIKVNNTSNMFVL